MPVDHPAPIQAPNWRMPMRLINLALGFLLTTGVLMALRSVINFGGTLS